MRLYLIRHPQPLVDADICYGSSDIDVVASSLADLTDSLAAVLPVGLPLYASPLRRCVGLANNLAVRLHCGPPILDARLMELHFGAWEMRRWRDIPHDEVNAWVVDTPGYCPGGGESLTLMAERVLSFRTDIRASGRDSIVICHAGTLRLLLASQHATSAADVAAYAASNPVSLPWGHLQRLEL